MGGQGRDGTSCGPHRNQPRWIRPQDFSPHSGSPCRSVRVCWPEEERLSNQIVDMLLGASRACPDGEDIWESMDPRKGASASKLRGKTFGLWLRGGNIHNAKIVKGTPTNWKIDRPV